MITLKKVGFSSFFGKAQMQKKRNQKKEIDVSDILITITFDIGGIKNPDLMGNFSKKKLSIVLI